MVALKLEPWALWNQLADTTWDGAADENAGENCGPESVAMCLWYLTGVALPADTIKDALYGDAYKGYTGTDKLAYFLSHYCSTPTKQYAGDANTKARPVVQAALSAGHPIIVLFFWDLQKLTGGHFCPIIACDDQSVTRANPWGGVTDHWSWEDFERYQQMGTAIECLRTRSIVYSIPNQPIITPPAQASKAARAYVITTDQDLRDGPAEDAPHGAKVTKGQTVKALPGPYFPHWALVQPVAGKPGYLLKSNGQEVY